MTMSFHPQLHVFHRLQVGSSTPVPEAPGGRPLARVWRVLNPDGIRAHGLIHGRTAFLEDEGHDWRSQEGGRLVRCSTRQAEVGAWLDVVLDYMGPGDEAPPQHRFDPMTGERLAD